MPFTGPACCHSKCELICHNFECLLFRSPLLTDYRITNNKFNLTKLLVTNFQIKLWSASEIRICYTTAISSFTRRVQLRRNYFFEFNVLHFGGFLVSTFSILITWTTEASMCKKLILESLKSRQHFTFNFSWNGAYFCFEIVSTNYRWFCQFVGLQNWYKMCLKQ